MYVRTIQSCRQKVHHLRRQTGARKPSGEARKHSKPQPLNPKQPPPPGGNPRNERSPRMLPDDAARLVDRVQAGAGTAEEDLYRVVCQAATARLSRCGAPRESAEDHAHDVFLIVLQSIQRGELREAGRLMGFVATIAHRHVAAHIASAVRARNAVSVADTPVPDWRANPEQQAI